ncbi:D-Ala-D-Ala carboxypeptidase family metallohydrolase [Sulfuriferula sp.]|uniref:D-Ala-D-Ala carboxypeptidase family metallohydrolase n=1 Tax=Sulfuriferula sp. TaxID=2025307 RepID=UPI002731BB8C|nr:D-Ala-D-Ala carboxypeptidase family metallohydrolase [Sulfuriferula sp.]MDP2026461.1 D-Ala-D-Ala carboxypeptidase family metallohydrolase [Sulfuriferula sp.]
MQLTPNFSLEELVKSDTALRRGIDNTPDGIVSGNLREYTAPGLEQVRALLGHAVRISSGYRCPQLNRVIGGSATSAHVHGLAADFTAPEYGTPSQIARAIAASDIQFDQLIMEGTWIHIGFAPVPRRQLLTAHFLAGRVRYSTGIA